MQSYIAGTFSTVFAYPLSAIETKGISNVKWKLTVVIPDTVQPRSSVTVYIVQYYTGIQTYLYQVRKYIHAIWCFMF